MVAIEGVARELVCDRSRSGLFAEPGNPVSIAAAIRQLADDAELRGKLGRNGREWVEANASREMVAADYLEVLRGMVEAG